MSIPSLVRQIEAEPEDTNEEFRFGTATFGLVVGQDERSAGFGLLIALDTKEPEPGFQIVLGPLALWWRRNYPFTISLLNKVLFGTGSNHAS